jgi:RNA polymerase sigma-70 factor (ECF subfamily)
MLTPDAHAADDALQDVWFDVFRNVGRLEDAGAFPAWLYRIARDRAYRLLRRRGVRVASPIDEAADLPANEVETPDAEDVGLVHASLDRLPHEQREVLLLRFVEAMTYEQIALAVGCGVGTVRSRLHYAKRALRADLERELERTGPS